MRALLGPTNTGKTHLALEELLAHDDGVIGFPLRLLAREGYDRLCARVGVDRLALVTGEEKIVPPGARYFACTVEAMPERGVDDRPFSFVAVDEIQLCADRERGHVFTDRLLHRRGTQSTMVLGADTMAPALRRLVKDVVIESRPRLSTLSCAGEARLARLPRRSAVVAFSVADVYAIAEEVRHHHGGAAVVTGALSPATRNAQVAMFQAGEVDVLVATDAIGMGLNLDIDHVAFAAVRKFDGEDVRELTEPELAQIAGRAGRHLKDGTFGTTRGVAPFAADVVERIERNRFQPLDALCFRNAELDYSSLEALHASLRRPPSSASLHFGRPASDLLALERLMHDPAVRASVGHPRLVQRFFEHCQIPDFEKTGPVEHAHVVLDVWRMTEARGADDDWMARRVREVEDTGGDLETLVARLARVRTLTYVAHKSDWLRDAAHWQGVTRAVEDRLSDALHERLTQRFVDRLARVVYGGDVDGGRGRGRIHVDAAVDAAGGVVVAGETIGRMAGLRFVPDAGQGVRARLQTTAAARGLQSALRARVDTLLSADDGQFVVDPATLTVTLAVADVAYGEVGRLVAGQTRLWPRAMAVLDRAGGVLDEAAVRRQLDDRLTQAVRAWVRRSLPRVVALTDVDLPAGARAVAHALVEGLGVAERAPVERLAGRPDEVAKKALRRHGVRLGFLDVFTDDAFKERALRCRAALLSAWRRHDDQDRATPALPPSGASSFLVGERPSGFVRALGFHVLPTADGPRAFRGDLVDDVAAELKSHPPGFSSPASACERLGCSHDALAAVLALLGYTSDDRAEPRRWRRRRSFTAAR
jgi:ATP-dependent RNA helicase SUPV3L1/SUV3